ncbi:hypothetical protein T06_7856 [Trichinella sp. T6]|nr:hypothetical protein T06_7856 [Trichinella sp. T6]
MNVKACSNQGAGELTRLHDDLNRHFLELKALGKDVNCGLSGFHLILPTLKRKLPSGMVTEWKTFIKDMKDDEIHSYSPVFLAFLLEQARIKKTDIRTRTKAPTKGHQQEPYHNARKPDLRFTTVAVPMEPGGGCPVCKGDHLTDRCLRRDGIEQCGRNFTLFALLKLFAVKDAKRGSPISFGILYWRETLSLQARPQPSKLHWPRAVTRGTDSTEAKASLSRNQNERSKMDQRKEPPLSESISPQLKVRPQSGCQ